MGSGIQPYCTISTINEESKHNLQWWQVFLCNTHGQYVQGIKASTLLPTFGDRSRTRTGVTFQLPHHPLQMWKGIWAPAIQHYTSNWKELATLLETVQQIINNTSYNLAGCTLFYFTDKSTTYWINTSGASSIP